MNLYTALQRSLVGAGVASALALTASPAAAFTLTLPGDWAFDPTGTGAHITQMEKITLSGFSHIDNTFNQTFTAGTFVENGLLQVVSYVNPTTGTDDSITLIDGWVTGMNMYMSWHDLAGSQVIAGSKASIDFTNGGLVDIYLDTTPQGTMRINGAGDDGSFLNWSDGLTKIGQMMVIDSAFNTQSLATEFTGGSFDLALGAGNADALFVIWSSMDARNGYWYGYDPVANTFTLDLDEVADNDFAGFAGDDTTNTQTDLQARVQVGSTYTLFSTNQDENYEEMIQGIYSLGTTPTYDQKTLDLGGGVTVLEDFYTQHQGNAFGDIQAVPEPSIVALLAAGLGGLGFFSRRRMSKRTA
jgi:hypothetical protein